MRRTFLPPAPNDRGVDTIAKILFRPELVESRRGSRSDTGIHLGYFRELRREFALALRLLLKRGVFMLDGMAAREFVAIARVRDFLISRSGRL